MQYKVLLNATLFLTILLLILSLVSVILTAHYWFLGDWYIPRFLDQTTGIAQEKVTLIEYKDEPTNSLVVSACLGLFGGIVSWLAWSKLKKSDMDMEIQLPRRRFYVGFASVSVGGAFASCLTALALHFTQVSSASNGCDSQTNDKGDEVLSCTREMGACRVVPGWAKEGIITNYDHPWAAGRACNEAQAVKWLQLLIALLCLVIISMFFGQAWLRKRTRYQRVGKHGLMSDS